MSRILLHWCSGLVYHGPMLFMMSHESVFRATALLLSLTAAILLVVTSFMTKRSDEKTFLRLLGVTVFILAILLSIGE